MSKKKTATGKKLVIGFGNPYDQNVLHFSNNAFFLILCVKGFTFTQTRPKKGTNPKSMA